MSTPEPPPNAESVRLATVAYEAMLWHFEHAEDCICADDAWDSCWYRYTSDEKRQARIDYIASRLEAAHIDGSGEGVQP